MELVRKLGEEIERLVKAGKLGRGSRMVLVDDGSEDGTWKRILAAKRRDERVVGVKLTRNFGQQSAILAGLEVAEEAGAEATISLDADLQDDIGVIEEMVDKFQAGVEIALGVRKSRKTDSLMKRGTAAGFYWLMNRLGVKMTPEAADFRLMSRRAVEELDRYTEVNLFLRGVVPELGLRVETVEYERGERTAGRTKYSFGKMINLAISGVTASSVKPLRFLGVAGLVMVVIGVWGGAIWVVGGLQVMAMGVVGEYIGRIYLETKRRPRYIIEEVAQKDRRRRRSKVVRKPGL